jgi:F-type H+-transporting ATPase subunit gamma
MSNLKNIKNRILSIKSTQKITKAMKMVAAAKVRKAELAVKLSRPFTSELFKLFVQIDEILGDKNFESVKVERALDDYPELLKNREIKTVGLVVITSNKGLAGAYSTNVVRFAVKRIKEIKEKGQSVKVYLVGQKSFAPLRNLRKSLGFEIVQTYTNVVDDLNPSSALVVSEDLAQAYVDKKLDSIELITTRYQNMMTYKVEDWTLLPSCEAQSSIPKKFHEDEEEANSSVSPEMLFEPNVQEILAQIVPMYVTNVIYQALLEASASELASRMTAMSAATNNAQEMIRMLTIDYNKARQEQITQELTEVVSGADALK